MPSAAAAAVLAMYANAETRLSLSRVLDALVIEAEQAIDRRRQMRHEVGCEKGVNPSGVSQT